MSLFSCNFTDRLSTPNSTLVATQMSLNHRGRTASALNHREKEWIRLRPGSSSTLQSSSQLDLLLELSPLGRATLRPPSDTGRWLQHVHDEVVHLVEHHKVKGETRSSVLRRRITRQPGEGVVLLQHISVQSHTSDVRQ